MRILVAGVTGAIGKRLMPLLVAGGHHVVAVSRNPTKLDGLRNQGADLVIVDSLDTDAVIKAIESTRPDVVVYQTTAIASTLDLKRFDREFVLANRLCTEGTESLLAAARSAGVYKFLVQSCTGWPNERQGGRIKTEVDALDSNPPKSMTKTLEAIRSLESMVQNAQDVAGIVLRYGTVYGPGTSLSPGGRILEMVRRRQLPLVGNGAGVWSFIHIDDAAYATQLAIEHGTPGLYNVVDDEPAEATVWLPELARAIGAKPPYHVPAWLGRLVFGDAGLSMMTTIRGSSNAKAKRILGWHPEYASWRDGFRRGLVDGQPPEKFLKAVETT